MLTVFLIASVVVMFFGGRKIGHKEGAQAALVYARIKQAEFEKEVLLTAEVHVAALCSAHNKELGEIKQELRELQVERAMRLAAR